MISRNISDRFVKVEKLAEPTWPIISWIFKDGNNDGKGSLACQKNQPRIVRRQSYKYMFEVIQDGIIDQVVDKNHGVLKTQDKTVNLDITPAINVFPFQGVVCCDKWFQY